MLHALPSLSAGFDSNGGRWHYLYRTATIVALIMVVLFLFQIVAFFVWPPSTTVEGHFAVLQSRPLVGLVSLDFVIIVDEVLVIPLTLALYLSLRRTHESLVLIATALAAVSLICFIVANPSLNMLYLSQNYAAATTVAERQGLLAAGQAVLSSWQGTCFHVGYDVGTIGMVLISRVMLRSSSYSRTTAYVGIIAGLVGFGVYVPKVGVYISILSVVGMQVWYVLIAVTLWRVCDLTAPSPLASGKKAAL